MSTCCRKSADSLRGSRPVQPDPAAQGVGDVTADHLHAALHHDDWQVRHAALDHGFDPAQGTHQRRIDLGLRGVGGPLRHFGDDLNVVGSPLGAPHLVGHRTHRRVHDRAQVAAAAAALQRVEQPMAQGVDRGHAALDHHDNQCFASQSDSVQRKDCAGRFRARSRAATPGSRRVRQTAVRRRRAGSGRCGCCADRRMLHPPARDRAAGKATFLLHCSMAGRFLRLPI